MDLSPSRPFPTRGTVGLWLAALAGPVAWGVDLVGSQFLVRTVNQHQVRWPLRLLGVATLAAALWGVVDSRARARAAAGEEAVRTLARWGMALGIFFALIIAAQVAPTFVLGPRDLP